MNQSVQSAEVSDINLWEMLEHVITGWKWLVGGSVVGLVGAFGFLLLTEAQYEATAVISPATIGMIVETTTTTTATMTTVEPVPQTLERLKLVTFYKDDIVKACQADSASALANDVKAKLVKGNNLLSISYRAASAPLANNCIDSIVFNLTKSLSAIAAPLIKELEEQTAVTKKQIDDLERFLTSLDNQAAKSSISNELSTLRILRLEELLKLKKLYREQRIQLSEPLTQPTKLLEPIYVPDTPVLPRNLIAVLGGLMVGLFAGLLALFLNRGWRRYKSMST